MKYYTTPKISAYEWQFDAASQPHLLIGGTTGSGKSVALAGIIRSLLRFTPDEAQLLLIDPKGVELTDYDELPHSLGRFCNPDEIARVIHGLADLMDLLLDGLDLSGVLLVEVGDILADHRHALEITQLHHS